MYNLFLKFLEAKSGDIFAEGDSENIVETTRANASLKIRVDSEIPYERISQ